MDSKKDKVFKKRYFLENGKALTRWKDVDLPNCQLIANEIQFNDLRFNRLDATQLLKHALGIGYKKDIDAQLIYLYYDLDKNSRIGNKHWEELQIFSDKIGDELNFKAIRYQDLMSELENNVTGYDDFEEYRKYIQKRYSI